MRHGPSPSGLALAIAVVGAATIGGALVSQHVFGYLPCMLCLWQRWPYYIAVPLALALALAARQGAPRPILTFGFAALALAFAIGAGLGAYHAGVELGLWAGPASCAGAAAPVGTAGGLLDQIRTTRIVPCDAPVLFILGLSLAVWNMLIAAALAFLALFGAVRTGGAKAA